MALVALLLLTQAGCAVVARTRLPPATWTDRDPRFKDRRLVVADWKTGEQRYTVDLPAQVSALDLRPSGRVVATRRYS